MSPYDQEFEELHKLLDRKLSDLRYWYKIEKQGMLSAYDIFNSQKVDEYLQREGGCKSLVPGEVDEKLLAKRFGIAYRVVSQDHKLQNEDPAFCGNAQKILNKAKEILKDKQKDSAYSAWLRSRVQTAADSETEYIELEKARREAAEEKQKRRELEERLAEAERHGASQNTSEQAAKKKVSIPAGCLIWLGLFLAIGFWQQCGYRGTIGNRGPPIQPIPSAPIPHPVPSLTTPDTTMRSPQQNPSNGSANEPSIPYFLSPTPSPPQATTTPHTNSIQNPTPLDSNNATWPDGRMLYSSRTFY
jgi:hypothetical protein